MSSPDGSIALSFGALQSAESQLSGNLSTLRARLEQLETELQPLVQTWTGDAQAAYLIQKKQWEQAADDLAIMLRRDRHRSGQHQHRLRRCAAQDRRGLQLTIGRVSAGPFGGTIFRARTVRWSQHFGAGEEPGGAT